MFDKLKDKMKQASQTSPTTHQRYGAPSQSYQAQSYQAGPAYGQPQFAPPPGPPPPDMQGQQSMSTGSGSFGGAQESQLAALKRFDTVLLIDDSESMEMHWDQTRDALMGLVDVAVRYDSDGLDCYFFNNQTVVNGLNSSADMKRLFQRIEPRRSTPTATAMRRITEPYMKALEASKSGGPRPKPLNLLILTDGAPNRGEEPDNLIIDLAQRLDAGRFPPTQLGVQFVQIGDDSEAREALQHLDDNLSAASSGGKLRDICDTTLFQGRIDSDYVIQALLGGINRTIDRKN